MKNLLLIITLLIGSTVRSQYCPALGPDQYLPCGIGSATLTADLSQCGPGGIGPQLTTDYLVAPIAYTPQANTGTLLGMSDDSQQGPFPIGFNFCFYGQTYTQFWVGSNGWISFSGAQPTTFITQTIPTGNALVPKNCIMGPWQDWHPGFGGQIRYQTSGVAPCRKLTVSWVNMPMYSCTSNLGTFHIVIYESTNYIESYIQNKPACNWQGGTAIQGIHNLLGTLASTVPGRNSTAWTATNDAYRWTPNGPIVVPILTWYEVGNPIAIGTGPTINVTPPAVGLQYTCRFVYPLCNAGWSSCNAIGGFGPDTVFVQPGPPNLPLPIISAVNPICMGSCDGSISVTPIGGTGVQTIAWNNSLTSFTLNGLCSGSYSFTILDANNCNISGLVALVDPPMVTIGPIVFNDTVCFGSTSAIYSVPLQGSGYSYEWSTVGSIMSPQGNDSVYVDWAGVSAGFIPGAVNVTAYNQFGCNSLTESIDLTIFDLNPAILPAGPFCSNDEFTTLQAVPGGGTFSGTGLAGNDFYPQNANVNNMVTYTYLQSGCFFSDSINILVNQQPFILDITPNDVFSELCEGDTLTQVYDVSATLPGVPTWYIQTDTIVGPNLQYTWNTFGFYTISATYETLDGCVSPVAQTTIILEECPQELIYIPNTFTPNSDEINNEWTPVFTVGYDPANYHAILYNRWGKVIWESYTPNTGWDGTYKSGDYFVPDGTYVYYIAFGNLKNSNVKVLQGHVLIMR